ncbi:hypothetical protein GGX14DRAFT_402622 [Mycena pura]|uniref:Uncharacterized protein n=1 Tax=Mycena pura TaxID=153505 RepID=A0AAD6V022_9AGAR|nr:hypothetical protein GGX14DRAFT_402622 [Mycena pura]
MNHDEISSIIDIGARCCETGQGFNLARIHAISRQITCKKRSWDDTENVRLCAVHHVPQAVICCNLLHKRCTTDARCGKVSTPSRNAAPDSSLLAVTGRPTTAAAAGWFLPHETLLFIQSDSLNKLGWQVDCSYVGQVPTGTDETSSIMVPAVATSSTYVPRSANALWHWFTWRRIGMSIVRINKTANKTPYTDQATSLPPKIILVQPTIREGIITGIRGIEPRPAAVLYEELERAALGQLITGKKGAQLRSRRARWSELTSKLVGAIYLPRTLPFPGVSTSSRGAATLPAASESCGSARSDALPGGQRHGSTCAARPRRRFHQSGLRVVWSMARLENNDHVHQEGRPVVNRDSDVEWILKFGPDNRFPQPPDPGFGVQVEQITVRGSTPVASKEPGSNRANRN